MVLQHQGHLVRVWSVLGPYLVLGGAFDDPVVLDEHAVVQHRDSGRPNHLLSVEYGPVEDDVVALPLARALSLIHI